MSILLADGNNIVRRIYEVHKERREDLDSQVIEQVIALLRRCILRFHPTHAALLFDSHRDTWRHYLEPSYKSNRPPTPSRMLELVPALREQVRRQTAVISIEIDGYEADDVIATIVSGVHNHRRPVVILSTDKGYQQLVDELVNIFDPFAQQLLVADAVLMKQGVKPDQLRDYWALTGDSSSNIKGVPGVGPTTARKLIDEFGTLEAILATDGIRLGIQRKDVQKVHQHRQQALVCRQLMSLKTDVELGINLHDLRLTE